MLKLITFPLRIFVKGILLGGCGCTRLNVRRGCGSGDWTGVDLFLRQLIRQLTPRLAESC